MVFALIIAFKLISEVLEMVFFETKYVDIVWDETNHIVRTTFKAYMYSEQLRDTYEKIIECNLKYRASLALCDMRNFVTIRQEDQKWINEVWRPKMDKAGMKKVAVILPDNMIQKQVVEIVAAKVLGSLVHNFASIPEALVWLKN
jgi:hypothetical protein